MNFQYCSVCGSDWVDGACYGNAKVGDMPHCEAEPRPAALERTARKVRIQEYRDTYSALGNAFASLRSCHKSERVREAASVSWWARELMGMTPQRRTAEAVDFMNRADDLIDRTASYLLENDLVADVRAYEAERTKK